MFAKNNRFSFKKGIPKQLFSTPLFVVRYGQNDEPKLAIAVVVGKKVDKRAVVRNRIKRMIVASIKELLDVNKPYKIVVYAKKQVNGVSHEQLKQELESTFRTIKIING